MEKLSLESFRGQKFPFHINTGIAVFQVKNIIEERYQLDFDVFLPSKGMNLQRPLVWTLLQKQQLIISIFKGMKLPNLTLIRFKDGDKLERDVTYQVIDGKQRLTTMIDFCRGLFPIEVDGAEYYYDDLPEKLQHEISWFWVVADVGYDYVSEPISDEDKIRWFSLINFSGTPQDLEHMKSLQSKI